MAAAADALVGPAWLVDDMLRVESLLIATAGESEDDVVSEAALHLIKAGGKRLRPALALISSRAGSSGRKETDLAAAAVELVHLATLYHDDVIDHTDTRRGVPTVHSKWGTEVAVLAGDYLFARGCGLGAQAGGEVPLLLANAIAEVCEGQIAETVSLGEPLRPIEDYLRVIERKTAALFRAACELGAATAEADERTRAAVRTYGLNLGMAFQVVDDLLDLVGDPEVTGKMPGTDLRDGVFTVPLLLGAARESTLAASLGAGERDLAVVLPILDETGALRDAHQLASDYGANAQEALRELPDEEWVRTLATLIRGVVAQVDPLAPS